MTFTTTDGIFIICMYVQFRGFHFMGNRFFDRKLLILSSKKIQNITFRYKIVQVIKKLFYHSELSKMVPQCAKVQNYYQKLENNEIIKNELF